MCCVPGLSRLPGPVTNSLFGLQEVERSRYAEASKLLGRLVADAELLDHGKWTCVKPCPTLLMSFYTYLLHPSFRAWSEGC